MSAVIAKTAMGVCTCGLTVEAGEYALLRPGGAIHVNCPERVTSAANNLTETKSSGFLFSDPVQAESERVKEKVGAASIAIHGATYSGSHDRERLTKHLLAVFELMKDGEYRTTEQIAATVQCGECTAQARMRQLRAIGHTVPKRWIKGENGASGHFEYALEVNRSLVSDEWERQHGSRAA